MTKIIAALTALSFISPPVSTRYESSPVGAAGSTTTSRVIEIGDIDPATLDPAVQEFIEATRAIAEAGGGELTLQINSYGGSVALGLSFIQLVEQAKRVANMRVRCVVDWKAMSMGFAILQSPACDMRLMTKRSLLLAHNSSTQAQGTVTQIENDLGLSRALDNALAELCAARLRIPVAEYRAKIQGKDWVMAWTEALEVGAVDGVVDPAEIFR